MIELWSRIRAALNTQAPRSIDALQEGASDLTLARLERVVGGPIPRDLARGHSFLVGAPSSKTWPRSSNELNSRWSMEACGCRAEPPNRPLQTEGRVGRCPPRRCSGPDAERQYRWTDRD